jgi:hypothetical protein
MDGHFYGYGLFVFELRLREAQCVLGSTREKTWFKGRSRTDVCVFGYGLLWGWKTVSGNCERSTWVYTVDGEDIRSSGLVNGGLMMYTPRYRCGVQVDRQPDDGLSRRVFGSFLTARIGVSVGRLPKEVLLEEFYRSERSETAQVGRLRVFEELLAVFNCIVLTFGEQ